MYNGVGVPTTRGTGTNGYVQRNLSYITRPVFTTAYNDRDKLKKLAASTKIEPNKEILEHERRRNVELRCAEYETELEDANLTQEEINIKVGELRRDLMEQYEQEQNRKVIVDGKEMNYRDYQEKMETQIKNAKMREAFGLKEDHLRSSFFGQDKPVETLLPPPSSSTLKMGKQDKTSWLKSQKRKYKSKYDSSSDYDSTDDESDDSLTESESSSSTSSVITKDSLKNSKTINKSGSNRNKNVNLKRKNDSNKNNGKSSPVDNEFYHKKNKRNRNPKNANTHKISSPPSNERNYQQKRKRRSISSEENIEERRRNRKIRKNYSSDDDNAADERIRTKKQTGTEAILKSRKRQEEMKSGSSDSISPSSSISENKRFTTIESPKRSRLTEISNKAGKKRIVSPSPENTRIEKNRKEPNKDSHMKKLKNINRNDFSISSDENIKVQNRKLTRSNYSRDKKYINSKTPERSSDSSFSNRKKKTNSRNKYKKETARKSRSSSMSSIDRFLRSTKNKNRISRKNDQNKKIEKHPNDYPSTESPVSSSSSPSSEIKRSRAKKNSKLRRRSHSSSYS